MCTGSADAGRSPSAGRTESTCHANNEKGSIANLLLPELADLRASKLKGGSSCLSTAKNISTYPSAPISNN
jgi:hypothetical protein